MRHAKAAGSSPDGSDHARPLTERGLRDAAAMGRAVAADFAPDAIVCSTAARASETAEAVAEAVAEAFADPPPLRYTDDLYHASANDWARVASGFDDAWQTVLAVAHNPGVGDLLRRLGGDGYAPTATIGVIELDDWADLLGGRLVDVLRVEGRG